MQQVHGEGRARNCFEKHRGLGCSLGVLSCLLWTAQTSSSCCKPLTDKGDP
jgi:hypothetical protein